MKAFSKTSVFKEKDVLHEVISHFPNTDTIVGSFKQALVNTAMLRVSISVLFTICSVMTVFQLFFGTTFTCILALAASGYVLMMLHKHVKCICLAGCLSCRFFLDLPKYGFV